jgi:hypothetical protein
MLQCSAMICTRVVLSTRDRENHPTLYQSLPPKGSRLQQSPSPKASFYGPAVLAVEHRSSPVALRNRDLYPHLRPHNRDQCPLPYLLLRNNLDLCLSQWQHFRTVREMHAVHQQHERFLLLHRRRLGHLQHLLHRRSPHSRLYMTSQDNQQAS